MRPQHRVSSRFPLKLILLCLVFLCACHTSDDATAAAKQLATTSTDLIKYYSVLVQIVVDDISLGDLQNSQGQTMQLFDSAKELTAQVEDAFLRQRLTRPIPEISNDESRYFLTTACLWSGSLSMGVPE
jgi:hypothetical protein